jgi:hypothetical protein
MDWTAWELVDSGHGASTAPAVTSWGPDRTDLFFIDGNGHLRHSWAEGSEWHSQTFDDFQFDVGTPAAVFVGTKPIDVFRDQARRSLAQGLDGEWSGVARPRGRTPYGLAVASWGPNRLDVFGSNGRIHHKAFRWPMASMGTGPGRVRRGPRRRVLGAGRIDLFAWWDGKSVSPLVAGWLGLAGGGPGSDGGHGPASGTLPTSALAPTPSRVAALLEQRGEVAEGLGREWADVERPWAGAAYRDGIGVEAGDRPGDAPQDQTAAEDDRGVSH